MKVAVVVTGERARSPHYASGTEPYEVARLDLDGQPSLIAEALRALADSIHRPLGGAA